MSPTLFTNGRFRTLDPLQPEADALLADAGRILAVGEGAHLAAAAPAGTVREDLGGACVLPGFTDSHIHTASLARAMTEVSMRGTRSLEEALERLAEARGRYAPGAWIFGGWWDHNAWEIPVQPDLRALDSLCQQNPVALTSADGHTVWANSLALAHLGIHADSEDPTGGEYVRDGHGQLTGILRESAVFPVRELAGTDLSGNLETQLLGAQQYLLSHGVTSLHDIDGPDAYRAFVSLRGKDLLGLRVHKLLAVGELEEAITAGIRSYDGDEWISRGAVKIFSDGAAGSHTCHMSEAFAGEPGNVGIEVTAYPEMARLARNAAEAGIALAIHAIGDRANHLSLNALAEVAETTRRFGLRHRIEHAQFVLPRDVQRFAALDVIASMQPQHCPADLPLLGMIAGRDLACYAWKSMLAQGARVIFGSDSPIEPPVPLQGIHDALTRTNAAGEPVGGWQPEERLSLEQAVHGYCVAPAYASKEENVKGRLRAGMLADFIVLDADPFEVPTRDLAQIQVTASVVGGVERYRRDA